MAKPTEEQLKEYRDIFNLFDKNKDGQISCAELINVCKVLNMNMTEQQVQNMLKKADKDGNGALDFKEFLDVMLAAPKSVRDDALLLAAFKQYDQDGDGYITAKELRRMVQLSGDDLTDQEINDMIKQADTDGDGRVNLQEFLKLMKD